MLVVLTILGFIGSLVLARGPQRSVGLEMRLLTEGVAQTLRVARTEAMARGRPVSVVFGGALPGKAGPSIAMDTGQASRLPLGVTLAVTSPGGLSGVPQVAILFRPNGSSTGGTVALAGSGQRGLILVDWLTGQVTIATQKSWPAA
jgi:general secretion pathway protein H